MTYPKFKNKHLENAFFGANILKEENKINNLPNKFVIIYSKKILNHFKTKYFAKRIFKHELFEIYKHKTIGLIWMKGIGSPHAVAVIENIISAGGKEFLNIGCAGGLQHEGIFLCTKALRDEATSYHYTSHGHFSFPDKELTKKLGESIKKSELDYEEGATWTIDAPYRETKAEVEHYKKQGIKTVEMESSALFTLAKIKTVKIASAFIVSDTLYGERKKFHKKAWFMNSFKQLFDAAVECLLA